jgi:hypothetical protein
VNNGEKDKRMKMKNRLLGVSELMEVAAKTDRLSREAWEESKEDWITGRLARDPRDVDAICHATVEMVKKFGTFSFEIPEEQGGWFVLQISMMEVSYDMWEQLWNDAHPDRFEGVWDGVDFELMSVWRERVRTMIRECRQEAILAITVEEYFAQVTAVGPNEEVAEMLADWMWKIHEGDTPST